jgi:hypothetical protein
MNRHAQLILDMLTDSRHDAISTTQGKRFLAAQEFFEQLLDCGDPDCTHRGCESAPPDDEEVT